MGSIINTVAIIAGGLVGLFVGKLFTEEQQDALIKTCGVSVLFIAIAGAMEGMLSLEEGALHSGKGMFVVLCLAMGTIIGELIGIEKAFERFGEWLKAKTGNSGDRNFVNATLAVKSVLDFIIVAVMTSSMGKGCAFSAIPILAFEGGITLLAHLIAPVMTEAAIANLSLVGSILIFCVGLNLVWGKKVRVANMLPAVVLAVAATYLPW